MKKFTLVTLAVGCILALGVTGCEYERLDILSGHDTYNGTVLTNRGDVEVRPKSIVLKPGARFSIKTPYVTQFLAQMNLAILSGEGANIYLRTVSDAFTPANGIQFHYSTNGCTVRLEDGAARPLKYSAETEVRTLQLSNEAANVRIAVGCNPLFESSTKLPATEYVIVETLPNSSIEISGIDFFQTDRAEAE